MPSELGQSNGLPPGASSIAPQFITGGLGAPTFTTRSPGTRLVLRDALGASSADYAMGVESNHLWTATPTGSSLLGFKWYGGETELMRLASAPALGINCAPSEMLHLFGAAGTARMLYIQNTSNFHLKAGVDASNNGFIGATNDTPLRLRTNGVDRIYIHETSGKVGIGVSPTELLHVYGASGTTHSITLENSSTYHCKMGVSSSNVGFLGATNATPVQILTSGAARISIHETSGLITMANGIVESGVTRRTSGSSYTMLTGDRVIVFASGSSGALTLIASPETGRVVTAKNRSGGVITISPASGNIDGAASYNLADGAAVELRYDGSEWVVC